MKSKTPQAIAQQYNEDGFIVVRQQFNPDEIECLKLHVVDFIRDVVPTLEAGDVYFEDTPNRPVKSVFRLEQHDSYFAQLADDNRLRGLAEAILSDTDVVCITVGFFGKPAGDGSVTPAHQDNIFQYWVPPECLTITLAIDESSVANGALICQQGTHRLGVLPHRPSGVMGFSMQLIEQPYLEAHPEVMLCMRPGDIALHHITTVHRSDANLTDRDRRQLVICYRSSRAEQDQEALAQHRERLGKLHADNS